MPNYTYACQQNLRMPTSAARPSPGKGQRTYGAEETRQLTRSYGTVCVVRSRGSVAAPSNLHRADGGGGRCAATATFRVPLPCLLLPLNGPMAGTGQGVRVCDTIRTHEEGGKQCVFLGTILLVYPMPNYTSACQLNLRMPTTQNVLEQQRDS